MKQNLKIIISILLTLLIFIIFLFSVLVFQGKIGPSLLAALFWQITNETEIIGDDGFGNSLCLDRLQNPAVSFLNKENELFFAQRVNGRWQKEIVAHDAQAGHQTSLAFDKEGKPNILYISNNFSLKLATKINSHWKIEKIYENAALSPNLIFDKDNIPHISFWSPYKGLMYGKKIDGKWRIELVDGGKVGWWNSLALDDKALPHISYFDFENKDLLYIFFDGTKWKKEIVDFEGDVGRFNSLILDKENLPHISYVEENFATKPCCGVKYAEKEKDGWKIEKVDFERGAEKTKIAFFDNTFYISYFDGKFKLAKKINNSWQIYTIALKGNQGGDTSIFVDKNGKLYLIWQDFDNGKLKYTRIE
jgi:hypothetical protein